MLNFSCNILYKRLRAWVQHDPAPVASSTHHAPWRSTNGKFMLMFVSQIYFCESDEIHWDGRHDMVWPNGNPCEVDRGLVSLAPVALLTHHLAHCRSISLTTDDIEVRICSSCRILSEYNLIQLLELHVKWSELVYDVRFCVWFAFIW